MVACRKGTTRKRPAEEHYAPAARASPARKPHNLAANQNTIAANQQSADPANTERNHENRQRAAANKKQLAG